MGFVVVPVVFGGDGGAVCVEVVERVAGGGGGAGCCMQSCATYCSTVIVHGSTVPK